MQEEMQNNLDTYNFINIGVSHPNVKYTDDEILVECRSGMTSITLAISKLDIDLNELEKQCEDVHNKLNEIIKFSKDDNNTCWDILGYCGVMFLDWLKCANEIFVSGCKDLKLDEISYVRKAYVAGVKRIHSSLFKKTE